MKSKLCLFIIPFFFLVSCNSTVEKKNVHPIEKKKSVVKIDTLNFIGANPEKTVYVPNAETAIAIAEAVWYPMYNNKFIEFKPYVAKLLNNEIWYVETTLPKKYEVGGGLYAYINKKDGKIIKAHGYK